MTHINKQTGNEIEAIQGRAGNLTEVLHHIHVATNGTMIRKVSNKDFFFINNKSTRTPPIRCQKGDWIFYAEGKLHSWDTELFNRIFVEKE